MALDLMLKIDDGQLAPYFVEQTLKPYKNGVQYLFKFKNGYGASVIKDDYSYGNECDLWELALIFWDGGKYHLSYHEIVGNDVLGYLTDEKVNRVLKAIRDGKVDEPIDDLYLDSRNDLIHSLRMWNKL